MEKKLGTFTVRKTGNSLSLTIPKELGVVSEDFYMLTGNDGTLVYTPQKMITRGLVENMIIIISKKI